MTRPEPPDLARLAFDELGLLPLADHSLQSVLQEVTHLADRILPGSPVTSVTVMAGAQPRTAASSDPLALELDQVQYAQAGGPCVQAAATGSVAEVLDTGTDPRWPAFSRAAADRGCRSVLSSPLPPHERTSGGLNVYARRGWPLDDRTREVVARFAAYAVVPVSNAHLYGSAVSRAEHLTTALDSRSVIDQAKGILMERFKLSADQAFSALTRVSMETNTKVRDVAARFVETGELRP